MEEFRKKRVIISVVAIVLLLLFLVFFLIPKQLDKQKAYIEFCKDKPNFCQCSVKGCYFNFGEVDLYGNYEKNINDLCELATSIKDDKLIKNIPGCLK